MQWPYFLFSSLIGRRIKVTVDAYGPLIRLQWNLLQANFGGATGEAAVASARALSFLALSDFPSSQPNLGLENPSP